MRKSDVLVSPAVLILMLFSLVSCGGGSGSSSPPSTAIDESLPPTQTSIWQEATPESVGMDAALLAQAFDQAFADGSFTQAALVIKDSKLVYERYRGILATEETRLTNATNLNSQTLFGARDKDSLATTWSTAKSFTSVMIAIAIEQGFIESLSEPASTYIDEWQNDERASISIRNLLDMRSGLPLVCYDFVAQSLGTCPDPGSAGGNLVFSDDQMSACINRPMAATNVIQPWYSSVSLWQSGTWLYSNCDTMVLGEILYRATGQDLQSYADVQLFSKIGMEAHWWRDNTSSQVDGNYLAYCCLDATPRDFAKFGQLILNNGVWDGEQVIPSSYIDSIKNITVDSVVTQLNGVLSYGLQFWTLTPSPQDDGSVYPPANRIYSTIGFDGQYITLDFDNNMILVRNSLYSPVLSESGERKMSIIQNNAMESSLVGSLPNGLGLPTGSNYSHQKLLYGVTKAITTAN